YCHSILSPSLDPSPTLFPYTTLFRSRHRITISGVYHLPFGREQKFLSTSSPAVNGLVGGWEVAGMWLFNSGRPWGLPQNVMYVKDRKSTRLNSSHEWISYAVFCLKKK